MIDLLFSIWDWARVANGRVFFLGVFTVILTSLCVKGSVDFFKALMTPFRKQAINIHVKGETHNPKDTAEEVARQVQRVIEGSFAPRQSRMEAILEDDD